LKDTETKSYKTIYMDEIQYVVPPDKFIPQQASKPITPTSNPEKVVNKALSGPSWVKSHKPIVGAATAAILIVVGLAVVMLTGIYNPFSNTANESANITPQLPQNTNVETPTNPETPVYSTPVDNAPQEQPVPEETTASCIDSNYLAKLTAIYRFWSSELGDHLYTTDINEKPVGYISEGITGYVYIEQIPGTLQINRSTKTQIGSHYYTTSAEDPAIYGYAAENAIGFAFPEQVEGSLPWHRLHKGDAISDFIHTTDLEEKAKLLADGYRDEGIVAYICGRNTLDLPQGQ
jgi:hypothetical protein